jgi:PAS domain S-box-containing protein
LLQRQADLLDQSHDAIFTWKIGGGIVYWNKGAERLYGYTAGEAIGRSSHELLRTRSPVPMQEIEWQIAQQGSWYGELTHTTRDGRTVVVESRHVRFEYSGETYALETNRDITERKAHEEYVHLLMREVNHRAKNTLSVVSAIALQTATKNPEDFVERFSERIQALSASQDLLIRNQWTGIEIEDLVRAQLAHFANLIDSRIAVSGPRVASESGVRASHRARPSRTRHQRGEVWRALERQRARRHLVAYRRQHVHHELDRERRGHPWLHRRGAGSAAQSSTRWRNRASAAMLRFIMLAQV